MADVLAQNLTRSLASLAFGTCIKMAATCAALWNLIKSEPDAVHVAEFGSLKTELRGAPLEADGPADGSMEGKFHEPTTADLEQISFKNQRI